MWQFGTSFYIYKLSKNGFDIVFLTLFNERYLEFKAKLSNFAHSLLETILFLDGIRLHFSR